MMTMSKAFHHHTLLLYSYNLFTISQIHRRHRRRCRVGYRRNVMCE
jgi:hypothetical protein